MIKQKEQTYQKKPPTQLRNKKEVFRKADNDSPFWMWLADCFFFTLIENRFYSMKIKNEENFNKRNKKYSTIFFAPHSNWWDGLTGYTLCRRVFKKKMNIMVEELNRFPILSKAGAFSINKQSAQSAMKSLKYSVEILKDPNLILWIFPQGIIKPPNHRPMEFQTGTSYIAQKCVEKYGGVNLIPLATNYIFLREDKPEIIVDLGEPIFIDNPNFDRHDFTVNLENSLTACCDYQLNNIHMGNVDDYKYVFRQRLPLYKKIEKWLKKV